MLVIYWSNADHPHRQIRPALRDCESAWHDDSGRYLVTRSKLKPGSFFGAPLRANCHLSGPSDLTEPAIEPWSLFSKEMASPLEVSCPLSSTGGLPDWVAFQVNSDSSVIARSIVVVPDFARHAPTRSVSGASLAGAGVSGAGVDSFRRN